MRRLAIVVLALGTIGGFSFAACHHFHHYPDRRDAFERHIADVCTDAALRAVNKAGGPSPGANAH